MFFASSAAAIEPAHNVTIATAITPGKLCLFILFPFAAGLFLKLL
jgi:hypothetical protein